MDDAGFIEWDSDTKAFSISDSVVPSATANAWVGVYRTDLTLVNSRGKSKQYTFSYKIIDQEGDLWYSIVPAKKPHTIYIEPEEQVDYGEDPLKAITLMNERDAQAKYVEVNQFLGASGTNLSSVEEVENWFYYYSQ